MNIEMTESAPEGRWGTNNTKLAACLLVYGYQLCSRQPFMRMAGEKSPEKLSTSIWFQPGHPSPLVTESTAQDWEVAWRHWDELKTKTGRYENPPDWAGPLRVMRRALDARQWFATNFRGCKEPLPPEVYRTEDRTEVVCLISMGMHIFSSLGCSFVFDARKVAALHRDYTRDGELTAMQFAKQAIIQQEALVAAIKRPENVPTTQFRVGTKLALIPQNSPPSVAVPILRSLNT